MTELFRQDYVIGLGKGDVLYIVLRQDNDIDSHHQQENKGPIILTFQVALKNKKTILARIKRGAYVVRDTLVIREHHVDYVFIEDYDGNELCLDFK